MTHIYLAISAVPFHLCVCVSQAKSSKDYSCQLFGEFVADIWHMPTIHSSEWMFEC